MSDEDLSLTRSVAIVALVSAHKWDMERFTRVLDVSEERLMILLDVLSDADLPMELDDEDEA